MEKQFTSKNGKFICDITDIELDGVSVKLNPVHYGNVNYERQLGFITNEPEFFIDTHSEQYQMDIPDLKELIDFVDEVLTYLSSN